MPLQAFLTNEHGEKISRDAAGEDGAIVRAAERAEDYPRIADIDLYGNTVFNRFQLAGLRQELERLIEQTEHHTELQYLLDVRDLATECETAVHTYPTFVGD